MAYSLFAAPFVRVFGYNGPLVFHSFLLLLILLMGFRYLSLANRPHLSLAFLLSFLFASVAIVYFVWISPDFFNLCLVFTILFLWIYKIRVAEARAPAGPSGRVEAFLLSPGSDYLAAVPGRDGHVLQAAEHRPHGPALPLQSLPKKIPGRALLLALVFALTAGALFTANHLWTGEWNYQGGERKSFIGQFPLEKYDVTFDSDRPHHDIGGIFRQVPPAAEVHRL